MSKKNEVKIKNATEIPKQWAKGFFHQRNWSNGIKYLKSHPMIYSLLFLLAFSSNIIIGYINEKNIKMIAISTTSNINNPIYLIPIGGNKEFRDKVNKNNRPIVRVIRPKYFKGPQVLSRPTSEVIPPGSMIKAILVSGASNGSVKARSTESLIINGEVLIPSGAVFWGTGASSENRLYVNFQKLILKNGSVKPISAQAADGSDKVAGLKGSKLGNYGFRLAGSVGLNLLSGLSEGLRESDVKDGVKIPKSDLKNALLSGTAHATLDLSKELMNGLKNKKPMIIKKSGAQIYIIFDGD